MIFGKQSILELSTEDKEKFYEESGKYIQSIDAKGHIFFTDESKFKLSFNSLTQSVSSILKNNNIKTENKENVATAYEKVITKLEAHPFTYWQTFLSFASFGYLSKSSIVARAKKIITVYHDAIKIEEKRKAEFDKEFASIQPSLENLRTKLIENFTWLLKKDKEIQEKFEQLKEACVTSIHNNERISVNDSDEKIWNDQFIKETKIKLNEIDDLAKEYEEISYEHPDLFSSPHFPAQMGSGFSTLGWKIRNIPSKIYDYTPKLVIIKLETGKLHSSSLKAVKMWLKLCKDIWASMDYQPKQLREQIEQAERWEKNPEKYLNLIAKQAEKDDLKLKDQHTI